MVSVLRRVEEEMQWDMGGGSVSVNLYEMRGH